MALNNPIINFRVPEDVKQKLEDLAYKRRTTVTKLMQALVERELKNDEEEL